MSLFAVNYTYADDPEQLDANRADHRTFLGKLADEGVVVLSGPLAPGVGVPDAALLILKAESPEEILEILAEDPFQKLNLVEAVEVRGWNPVLGSLHPALEQ